MSEQLELAYNEIKKSIAEKAKLICVSKKKPIQLIEKLYDLGQRDFGENQVQELLQKSTELSHLKEIRWHFIGHLQSNKIKQLLSVAQLCSIHSIDRESLLTKILSKKPMNSINLFVQINTSSEMQKGGFNSDEEINTAVKNIKSSKDYNFSGFMTIGKIRTDNFEADAKKCFLQMRNIKEAHYPEAELSMGMSSDYMIALEYGANWVRVGSKIFGER